MRTVWKFGPVTAYDDDLKTDPQRIDLPVGYRFLHFDYQPSSGLQFWVEADTQVSRITRGFLIYGTGWRIRPSAAYRGTAIADGWVWHLYEVPA